MHITDFENPMVSALKLKKFSKKTSQSHRSKPGAEANQLTILFSSKLLTEGYQKQLQSCKTEG